MQPRDRALLLFAVGILLALNPVYLFPGGVPYQEAVTYRAERVENPLYEDVYPVEAVLDCSGPMHHRECVQATRVGYDGTLRVDTDREVHLPDDGQGLYSVYEYVHFDSGYARPNATVENGTLVLSFEPVAERAVMDRYAASYESLPPVAKRAVRNGTATVTRWSSSRDDVEPRLDDHQEFVNRNGTFYRVNAYTGASRPVVPPWLFGLLRVGSVLGGAALAFVARGRHARIVDERDEDDEPFPARTR